MEISIDPPSDKSNFVEEFPSFNNLLNSFGFGKFGYNHKNEIEQNFRTAKQNINAKSTVILEKVTAVIAHIINLL